MQRLASIGLVIALSGCSSMSLPSLDMLDSQFQDSEVDLQDYPDVRNAPAVPKDGRSNAEWDRAAGEIVELRMGLDVPPDARGALDPEGDFQKLQNEVRAYRLDDPE